MSAYRQKPVLIEAWQIHAPDDQAHEPAPTWLVSAILNGTVAVATGGLAIATKEGEMLGQVGDWIIRGVAGELYPCKPEIFEATYDAVAADALGEPMTAPEVLALQTRPPPLPEEIDFPTGPEAYLDMRAGKFVRDEWILRKRMQPTDRMYTLREGGVTLWAGGPGSEQDARGMAARLGFQVFSDGA